jgi:hypothetical protein
MDTNAKIAAGAEKFKKAVTPTTTDESPNEDQTTRIDKKRLALAVTKVAVGTGVLIAAWKIGTKMASKDEDQQDQTA